MNLNSFKDFFNTVFGCKPEDMIKEFKPFCEYDWKERTLTLITKDCSQLHEDIGNGLELIYDNHNENELIGFIIDTHKLNLYSSGTLVLNLYFYSTKLANPSSTNDSNWRLSSYSQLEFLLRYLMIELQLKKRLYHLIGMVDGIEHKNYEDNPI